jgi:hypothetical protein
MALSFALTLFGVGAAALTMALNCNVGYLITPGLLSTGSFGTLSSILSHTQSSHNRKQALL